MLKPSDRPSWSVPFADCSVKISPQRRACGESSDHPSRRLGEEEQRPAGDDGVVAEQYEPAQNAPHSYEAPRGTHRFLEGTDRTLLSFSSDQKLGHHDREPDGSDAYEIHENECAPVVLPRNEREFPEVSQSNGTSGGGQDEACTGGPVSTLLCHVVSGSVTVASRNVYVVPLPGDARRTYPAG